jgi:hypothetical protein
MTTSQRPARGGLRRLALAALAALCVAGCYGPHMITYVDSSRAAGERTFSHSIDHHKVDFDKCGGAGIARIETYSTWPAMLVSYLTWSTPDRSAEIVCGVED